MSAPALEARLVPYTDPLVRPLLAELDHEYTVRYGHTLGDLDQEASRGAAEFAAPDGGLLLLLIDGIPVAGGAFRRLDGDTAELKRIWTDSAHRRRGLGRQVLVELEREIADRGYRRVYLTTGPRQPEAKALYLAAGYTPLFDLDVPPELVGKHPFEKDLAVLSH
jgi:GNAT superfamily N-acetyltransferase